MTFPPLTLGVMLAVIVIVICIVLALTGQLPVLPAVLIGMLALARLT